MRPLRVDWFNGPLVSLVVVNTIPLAGVLFLGWDAFCVVFLYWAENLVVGFYTVLRMACAKVPGLTGLGSKLSHIPFFVLHYGLFATVHGVFVLALFGKIGAGLLQTLAPVKYALIGLFLSHGVSFVDDYLLGRQYASARLDQLMFSPYPRLIVLHVSILAGVVFLCARHASGRPWGLLVVLIALKTILDAALYRSSTSAQSTRQTLAVNEVGERPGLR